MSLKKAYLYLISVISLVIWVIGAIMLLNMALKTWVFTKAEQSYYYNPCDERVPSPKSSDGVIPAPCTAEERARHDQRERDNRMAQKQRDAAQALAMIIIAAPVWLGHWRLAKREQ